jgi:hypothetical protein
MTELENVAKIDYSEKYARLVKLLCDQPWHTRVRFIANYMPPFPRPETQPTFHIEYDDGTEYKLQLRYSQGPKQGFFWDVYGEDFQNEELAIIALSQAPAPVRVGPIVVRLPLK